MTFQNLQTVSDGMLAAFSGRVPLTPLPCGGYASMRYPKFPALMRFSVRRYAAAGFGNVFAMDTRAAGGMMQLCTLVLTPNIGTDVPLLLVDVMAMGKKRAAFVEYYDVTAAGAACPALARVASRYADVPDYPEKPAWYVAARAPYSLIKGGTDDAKLLDLLMDTATAYAETCAAQTEAREANLDGLRRFVERMAAEGNPSSATMERLLGKDGAKRFFRAAIMPQCYTTQAL